MNKNIYILFTYLFVLVFFAACKSNNDSSDSDELSNDTIQTLADSMIKSDKEKSDSILKYYQDKANETPTE